jgi:hypothetical protein
LKTYTFRTRCRKRRNSSSATADLDYAVNDLREDLAAYFTGRVEDQSAIRREQAIGTNIARLAEPADLKINLGEGDCISIPDRLAGDLTQDAVLSLKFGQNQCRLQIGPCGVLLRAEPIPTERWLAQKSRLHPFPHGLLLEKPHEVRNFLEQGPGEVLHIPEQHFTIPCRHARPSFVMGDVGSKTTCVSGG